MVVRPHQAAVVEATWSKWKLLEKRRFLPKALPDAHSLTSHWRANHDAFTDEPALRDQPWRHLQRWDRRKFQKRWRYACEESHLKSLGQGREGLSWAEARHWATQTRPSLERLALQAGPGAWLLESGNLRSLCHWSDENDKNGQHCVREDSVRREIY